MIPISDITGLILAGGLATRMGGADKGLQRLDGEPLVWHVARRLRAQVGVLRINANRHLDDYAALGVPVWPDANADRPGPLAGFLTGLTRCDTPYLATVPCDAPHLPLDLVARLARALVDAHADIAVAACGRAAQRRVQPVFCVMARTLAVSLREYLHSGQRQVEGWTAGQRRVVVTFDDAAAFANANTPGELLSLARHD